MAWLTGWAKREAITVGGGTADVTNFTKLVILTADTKRADALATGFDVRFTASDGSTTLFYKREAWTGGGGANVTAIFKVLVASIAQAGGALIYMYWGNAAAGDVSTTTNCWKAALVDAWDMRDGANNASIYGDKGNNGTKKAANKPAQVAGKIGLAQDFAGTDEWVDIGASAAIKPAFPLAVSAWINMDDVSAAQRIFTNDKLSATHSGIWLQMAVTTRLLAIHFGNNTGDTVSSRKTKTGTTALSPSQWYHVVGVISSATVMSLYVNGTDDAGGYTGTAAGVVYTASSGAIGRTGALEPDYFRGLIDDVRIYSEALSAAEVEYMFGEVNEAGNRCTFGGVEYAFSPAAAFLNLKTRSAA